MVLLACYECGNDVSSAAASCPKCGAPFEPKEDSSSEEVAPAPPPPSPVPVAAGAPQANKGKRGKVGVVVLAMGLLAFGGYGLATKAIADGSDWLAIAVAALLLLPLMPKKMAGLRPKVLCKHCGVAGHVLVNRVERKRGISGGKATGALLTGGLSLLATGLSRREVVSAMRCENCGMKWDE